MSTNLWPIIRKELKSYFNSPMAYIVMVVFLLFTSIWLFYLQAFFARNVASLRVFFGIIPFVFIVLMPAITMRGWAEEKKLGTMEVLVTLPYQEGVLVVGKFLAALSLLLLMILLTLPLPILLSRFGSFDSGEIIGQYLGVFLIGAAGISIGLFISSLATNQISAFVLSVFVILVLTLISQVGFTLGFPVWLAGIVNYLSLNYHYSSFQKGLIDTRDLFYYLLIVGLFLYLNTKSLVFRKWS